jgi:hypothetical protein
MALPGSQQPPPIRDGCPGAYELCVDCMMLYMAVYVCIWLLWSVYNVYGYVCTCMDCVRTVHRLHASSAIVCGLYIDCIWIVYGMYALYIGSVWVYMECIRTVYRLRAASGLECGLFENENEKQALN